MNNRTIIYIVIIIILIFGIYYNRQWKIRKYKENYIENIIDINEHFSEGKVLATNIRFLPNNNCSIGIDHFGYVYTSLNYFNESDQQENKIIFMSPITGKIVYTYNIDTKITEVKKDTSGNLVIMTDQKLLSLSANSGYSVISTLIPKIDSIPDSIPMTDFAVSPSGTYYMSSYNTIYIINSDGTLTNFASLDNKSYGGKITIDNNGFIYWFGSGTGLKGEKLNGNILRKLNSSGTIVSIYESTLLTGTDELTYANGYIYLASPNMNTVVQVDSSGNVKSIVTENDIYKLTTSDINFMAVDAFNSIYLSSLRGKSILKFTSSTASTVEPTVILGTPIIPLSITPTYTPTYTATNTKYILDSTSSVKSVPLTLLDKDNKPLNIQINGIVKDTFGNVYATTNKSVIIKIDISSGNCSIFAGTLSESDEFTSNPVIDSKRNIYITNYNKRLIYIVDSNSKVSTFAGNSTPFNNRVVGSAHKDGKGIAASFTLPYCLAIDKKDNIYVGDGRVIRKIDTDANVTTYVGNPIYTGREKYIIGKDSNAVFPNDNFLDTCISIDNFGNLYGTLNMPIPSEKDRIIFKVDTNRNFSIYAPLDVQNGNGNEDGPVATAKIGPQISFILFDSYNNMYFNDPNLGLIRKIDISGIVSTFVNNPLITNDNLPSEDADGPIGTAVFYNRMLRGYMDTNNNMYIPSLKGNHTKLRIINSVPSTINTPTNNLRYVPTYTPIYTPTNNLRYTPTYTPTNNLRYAPTFSPTYRTSSQFIINNINSWNNNFVELNLSLTFNKNILTCQLGNTIKLKNFSSIKPLTLSYSDSNIVINTFNSSGDGLFTLDPETIPITPSYTYQLPQFILTNVKLSSPDMLDSLLFDNIPINPIYI